MTSRARDSRRSARAAADKKAASRSPGIYRGPNAPSAAADHTDLQQVNVRRAPWRLFSGLIAASLIVVLILFFSTDVFFVHSIGVAGQEYLTDREIFALSGIADEHVFWIDPQAVRRNLLQSPTIADAQVQIGWGDPMVVITIEERQPAVIWEQAGISMWVDINGRVMRQRNDRDDLVRISVDSLMDGPPGGMVNADVVASALQLRDLMPEVALLRYHPDYGLGFTDSRGWEVWLGVGGSMTEKLAIYRRLVDDLNRRGVVPRSIYIVYPDRPWVSTF